MVIRKRCALTQGSLNSGVDVTDAVRQAQLASESCDLGQPLPLLFIRTSPSPSLSSGFLALHRLLAHPSPSAASITEAAPGPLATVLHASAVQQPSLPPGQHALGLHPTCGGDRWNWLSAPGLNCTGDRERERDG